MFCARIGRQFIRRGHLFLASNRTLANCGFSIPTEGYEAEDRLVEYERTSGLDQSWSLSLVGDWNSVTTNSTTQSRTHTAAHKMSGMATTGHSSSSVEHDVKGNVTLIESHYGMKSSDLALYWDFDNRMNSADADEDGFKDVIQMFDALGRRVSRFDDVSNATTIFVQFGQQTICDYASGASPSSSKYRYLYASYIDEPVMRWETAQSDAVYYHRNQQYSIIALTDDTGAIVERYSYTAYGELAFFDGTGSLLQTSNFSIRTSFTGREYDPIIRLYHDRARVYDPQLGRFLGRDPIGFEASKWNLLEFVRSRPLIFSDPSGMVPCTNTGIALQPWSTPRAIGGGWGISGGSTNNGPVTGTIVWLVVCARSRNINYIYSCTCPTSWCNSTPYTVVLTKTEPQDDYVQPVYVPGGVAITEIGITLGPATGVLTFSVWQIVPGLDQQKADNACQTKLKWTNPPPPPAPPASYDCPGVIFS